MDARERMIRRAALEIGAGMTVNLGIGLPTRVIDHVDHGVPVCLHSENGIAGVGPGVDYERADRNLIDAGGAYVSTLPGTAFFDSAVSFALVRRGRLDLTVLGAFEVAMNGDLANWMIPGLFTPGVGGGMELAQKARRVVVMMTHCDKQGRSKIVRECSLPLTAKACVDRIYTELAVIDVDGGALWLRELADGVSVDEVVAATGAPLQVPEEKLPTF
ncbi:MAG TPA: 3-oxoacid CoA-transferase subunit B [Gammaproteobacteria bacterium]|nr:3-oxoacid CoA-transferase subunit B [Gammaproteobacteria bacterium]